jgi:hypothetical protein
MFDPKAFTTSNRWWSFMWGNGHTPQTDPTRQGWRAKSLSKGSRTLLVGKPGVPGCFSAVPLGGVVDVALYEETPEKVRAHLMKEEGASYCDPTYHQVADISGWGLEALRLLKAEMEMLEQYK